MFPMRLACKFTMGDLMKQNAVTTHKIMRAWAEAGIISVKEYVAWALVNSRLPPSPTTKKVFTC